MNDNYFGFDDIFEDQQGKAHWSLVVEFLIRFVAAITTAGFFYEYVGNLFAWMVGPTYSPWLSAVVGVFCVDVLAWVWSRLRENVGSTETQITAATIGAFMDMGLSILVTVVFVILLTNFVELRTAAGDFNNIGMAVNISGLLVATLAMAGNVALAAYYSANSAQAREALQLAKLQAARRSGEFAVKDKENRMIIAKSLNQIYAALPKTASSAADANRQRFLKDRNKIGQFPPINNAAPAIGGGDSLDDGPPKSNRPVNVNAPLNKNTEHRPPGPKQGGQRPQNPRP